MKNADVTPQRQVIPEVGYRLDLLFDGRQWFLWWGPDADGNDCVAACDGKLLAWDSDADRGTDTHRRGWLAAEDGVVDDNDSSRSGLMNLEPAMDWLHGHRITLDPEAALNLWNIAGDAAFSIGSPWRSRGRVADRCYDKLLAANVPWAFNRDLYQPRWTPNEMLCLRRVLIRAMQVLRSSLPS